MEADESDGSFLKIASTYYRVITNIEDDHMDHYKTMDNLLNAFCKVRRNVTSSGQGHRMW